MNRSKLMVMMVMLAACAPRTVPAQGTGAIDSTLVPAGYGQLPQELAATLSTRLTVPVGILE